MSTYESYNEVCRGYDKGRQPTGLGLHHACLAAHSDTRFNEIHLLDAGCGTGSHAEYLLRHGIGKVTMMDASQGMLEVAKSKLKKYSEGRYHLPEGSIVLFIVPLFVEGRVQEFRQANLPSIPYENETFDAVMVNFVLQHLEDGKDPTFQNHLETFKEIHRVLKPGGLFLFQSGSYYQAYNCAWMLGFLCDRVKEDTIRRFPDTEQTKHLITEAGFHPPSLNVPVDDLLLKNEVFFNFEGILNKEWRDYISFFALQTKEEADAMIARIRKMMADNTYQSFINTYEENRKNSGRAYVLEALKSI